MICSSVDIDISKDLAKRRSIVEQSKFVLEAISKKYMSIGESVHSRSVASRHEFILLLGGLHGLLPFRVHRQVRYVIVLRLYYWYTSIKMEVKQNYAKAPVIEIVDKR